MINYMKKVLLGVMILSLEHNGHAAEDLSALRQQKEELMRKLNAQREEVYALDREIRTLQKYSIPNAQREKDGLLRFEAKNAASDNAENTLTFDGTKLENRSIFSLLGVKEPQSIEEFKKIMFDFCTQSAKEGQYYPPKAHAFITDNGTSKDYDDMAVSERAKIVFALCAPFDYMLTLKKFYGKKRLFSDIINNPDLLGEKALPLSPKHIDYIPFYLVNHVNNKYVPSVMNMFRYLLDKFNPADIPKSHGDIPNYDKNVKT